MKTYHKHFLLFILCCLSFLKIAAQNEGNVWVFGNYAGLDFNSGSPVPVTTNIVTIEGSASICDANGQLLFYTEGSTIWDHNGNPMPNGTNITGLIFPGYSPTASTTQSSLIVPMPDSAGKYFLFSLTDGTIAQKHNLYYSVIDMSLNSGLGDIIPGRKGILIDSILSEKLTATLGKCCNIWVVVNRSNGNFHAFEITAAGLNTTPVVSPSGINNGFSYNYGEIKFSNNGNKLAAVSQSFFGLRIYDFDGYTGIFSNAQTVRNRDFYGVCFSPDDTKLYAASDSLFQYDVSSLGLSNIIASEKIIAKTGGLTDLKLGPDGKIYFQGLVGLSAINFPNLSGVSSQVVPAAVLPLSGTYIVFGGLSNVVVVLKHDTTAFTQRDTSVCFKDSITLIAPPNGCEYFWDDGSTGITHIANHTGNYIVSYRTPPCIFHRDTITVHFAAGTPATGVYSGCGKPNSAYLYILPATGDFNTYTYTWRDSAGIQLQQHTSSIGDTLFGIGVGKYKVKMSGNGCDTVINLFVPPPQQVYVDFTADTIICIGDTSFFVNTSAGFNNFLWVFGDGDTSTSFSPAHVYPQPGVYYVSLIGFPCNDTLTKTITVDSNSYIKFTSAKQEYCLGEAVSLSAFYPPGVVSLLWDFGDGLQGHDSLQYHAYDTTGLHIIHLKAFFRACTDTSALDTIQIFPHPIVALGIDTVMCPNAPPLLLYNQAGTSSTSFYLWNTGDTTAQIYARRPAVYSLRITNEHGCFSADSIEIKKSCYLDIPNAFTPNGDGMNDYFFPRNLSVNALSAFHMQLFNRWGQIIFETNNVEGRGWDGSFNGKAQITGVYIYLIEARFKDGSSETYKGNVTLLR